MDYSIMITAAAAKYGIDPVYPLSVADHESGMNQYDRNGNVLRGKAGEFGIMQLMPATAATYGIDPSDPAQNIDCGVHLLSDLYHRYGNWPAALAAYNEGSGNYDKGRLPAVVRQYQQNIMLRANQRARQSSASTPIAVKPVADAVSAGDQGSDAPSGGDTEDDQSSDTQEAGLFQQPVNIFGTQIDPLELILGGVATLLVLGIVL